MTKEERNQIIDEIIYMMKELEGICAQKKQGVNPAPLADASKAGIL